MRPAHTLVIGIAGGSGSGKTTLVDHLLNSCHRDRISFLPHDHYYHNRAQMPETFRTENNWDHPDTLDNELFVQHVDHLLADEPIDRPVYDFATHSRSHQTIRVEPRPVLLLEGILLLAVPAIRERLHLRVYVDTPADLRVLRRMMRDIRDRGRTLESVAEQYQATVRPMHELFVEPSRAHAQLIVPWLFHNSEAVTVLLARIGDVVHAAQR
jgi:uridine kinase